MLKELATQLLVPPGLGVYTVHAGQDKKNELHKKLYGSTESAVVKKAWEKNLRDLFESQHEQTVFLGIPSDSGGGVLRGANWGPLALRTVCDLPVGDLGDVRVNPHFLSDSLLSKEAIQAARAAMYGNAELQLPVAPLSIAEHFLETLYKETNHLRVFGLGGDHSVAYPLVKTYLQARKKQAKRCALIHFDAHTDLMPNRLGVEICFGSWVHHVIPFLESASDLYQIGIRSSGKERTHWEKTYGIHQFWSDQVIASPSSISQKILADLRNKQINEIYLTFDIDVLDITQASATGTPEPNGLFVDDAVSVIKTLLTGVRLGGADLVEVAPFVHHPGVHQPEPDTTLNSATQIMQALIS